ncbi:MAG TPA: hypothetical protein VJ011_03880 [Steroidobacteraceae bacterium]|nr:hypothetical protein [Steroidobacteraceae bacterium]
MDPIERKIRQFLTAFYVFPGFRNWVRTRAKELTREGEDFEIIMVWGRRHFRIGAVPHGDPYFAIKRPDGSLERSPWV